MNRERMVPISSETSPVTRHSSKVLLMGPCSPPCVGAIAWRTTRLIALRKLPSLDQVGLFEPARHAARATLPCRSQLTGGFMMQGDLK